MTIFHQSLKRGGLIIALGMMLSFVQADDPFEEVVTSIKIGDVESLALQFDNRIEISFSNKSESYSKSQAAVVLKTFFNDYPPINFKLIHKGQSKKGALFGIGSLSTETENFRVTLFLRLKDEKYVLQELGFKESR